MNRLSSTERAVIEQMLTSRDDEDLTAKAVAKWKAKYPDAAKETSAALKPLMRDDDYEKERPDGPDEIWVNDVYQVVVRRRDKDPVFGTRAGMLQLGIHAIDGSARHDWRDFQAIKNQLAGAECESFELYPAESRLMDPSNYYTLWCFPGLRRLHIGNDDGRKVLGPEEAYAPQRGFAKGDPIE